MPTKHDSLEGDKMGLSLLSSIYMMFVGLRALASNKTKFGVFGAFVILCVIAAAVLFGYEALRGNFVVVDLLCFVPLGYLGYLFNTAVKAAVAELPTPKPEVKPAQVAKTESVNTANATKPEPVNTANAPKAEAASTTGEDKLKAAIDNLTDDDDDDADADDDEDAADAGTKVEPPAQPQVQPQVQPQAQPQVQPQVQTNGKAESASKPQAKPEAKISSVTLVINGQHSSEVKVVKEQGITEAQNKEINRIAKEATKASDAFNDGEIEAKDIKITSVASCKFNLVDNRQQK